jgi:hypothetical protein
MMHEVVTIQKVTPSFDVVCGFPFISDDDSLHCTHHDVSFDEVRGSHALLSVMHLISFPPEVPMRKTF